MFMLVNVSDVISLSLSPACACCKRKTRTKVTSAFKSTATALKVFIGPTRPHSWTISRRPFSECQNWFSLKAMFASQRNLEPIRVA